MTNQENPSKSSDEQTEVSPYKPPTAQMTELVSDNDSGELAGRGTRLVAHLADGFIFIIPFMLLFLAAYFMGVNVNIENLEESESPLIVGVLMLFIALMMIAIFAVNLIWLHRNGQTIGKRMMSIKIVRTDGSRATLLRIIFLRFFPIALLSNIPLIGSIFALLDPLLIFKKSRQCLHDQIADTIVINVFPGVRAPTSPFTIIAVVIIPAMFIIGILAAVAIPAFVDYSNKVQVAQTVNLLDDLKIQAEEYYDSMGVFPPDIASFKPTSEAEFAKIVSNDVDFYFQATLLEEDSQLSGKTIRLSYEPYSESWTCRPGSPNGMDNKYLPRRCRND
ncbi:MAG TPA: hypothetical protein EYP59_02435 [Thiotrichaceae bacterium]|nr:hypothetical protein [Thiotrichaceae bacterium]